MGSPCIERERRRVRRQMRVELGHCGGWGGRQEADRRWNVGEDGDVDVDGMNGEVRQMERDAVQMQRRQSCCCCCSRSFSWPFDSIGDGECEGTLVLIIPSLVVLDTALWHSFVPPTPHLHLPVLILAPWGFLVLTSPLFRPVYSLHIFSCSSTHMPACSFCWASHSCVLALLFVCSHNLYLL